MRGLLQRLVDVRKGEGRAAASAAIVLALLIASHTVLETARDALFLGSIPPNRLPIVYVLLAGLSLVFSKYSAWFSQRVGRRNALIFTLLISAYCTALLYFQPQTTVAIFGLYLWSGLLGTVLVLQFWMFAGQLFTVSQGKRLFGPVASGGVLGAVVGAGSAALLLKVMPVQGLVLVSAAIFAVCAMFLTAVPTDDERAPAEAGKVAMNVGRRNLGVFSEFPYLYRVGALIFLSTATVLITDYLFKSITAARVPSEELGEFFAQYYAGLNAIALVVQLILTGRLVRRLGVTSALTVLPLLLALGGVGTALTAGALSVVMMTKGADGSLRHSLHRVTMELLYLPLPSRARDRAKPVLDTALGRGAQAIAATLILALSALNLASPRVLGFVIAGGSIMWLLVAIEMRKPYIDLFRKALSKGSFDLDDRVEVLNLNSIEAMMEALSSRDPGRVNAAMDILEENNRARLIPGLILYHESEEVLVHALRLVARPGREDWVALAKRLLSHESPRVRAEAVRSLSAAGDPDALAVGAADENALVRAQAVFFQITREDVRHPIDDPRMKQMLSRSDEDGRQAQRALLDAIAEYGDERWVEVMLALSDSPDAAIIESLATAVTRLPDRRFIPVLIKRLSIRNGRGAVREAIAMMGEPALDALEEALDDDATSEEVRIHLPRTISRFRSQRALDVLTKHLATEKRGLVRYKILRGLGKLATDHQLRVDRGAMETAAQQNLIEHLRLLSQWVPLSEGQKKRADGGMDSGAIVLSLLEDKLRQSLERAFRLLQLAHRSEDLRNVYKALRSTDKRLRANASEFLDALTVNSPETRTLFRLVTDDLTPRERLDRATEHLEVPPTDYEGTVARLLADPDESVAAIASYHALDLGVIDLRDKVTDAFQNRPSLRAVAAPSILPPSLRSTHPSMIPV